jgi:brefeldin A-inhibited guanine nucleotide-exchange protein
MRLSFGGQVKLLQSDEEIKAPISDIKILEKKDALPEGYFKIMKDLNFGSGGTALYLCVKKDLSLSGGKHAPIGALSVIFPGRDEFLLPGFELVKRRGVAVDLNTGTGEKVHLCFKRSWTPAITNISVVFPKKNEKPQEGYETIESTPKGHQADVNAGCVNNPVFLCIKRSFDNFEQIKWSTTRSSRAGAAAGGGSGESRPAQSRAENKRRSFSDDLASYNVPGIGESGNRGGLSSFDLSALKEEEEDTLTLESTSSGMHKSTSFESQLASKLVDPAAAAEEARVRREAVEKTGDEPERSDASSETSESDNQSKDAAEDPSIRDSLSSVPAVASPSDGAGQGRFGPEIVTVQGGPISVVSRKWLHPLFIGCYSQRENVARAAIGGLQQFLENGFFKEDCEVGVPPLWWGANGQRLLVNLAVETVLGTLDHGQGLIQPILQFITGVTQASDAGIHPLTLHQAFSACITAVNFDVEGDTSVKEYTKKLIQVIVGRVETAGGDDNGSAFLIPVIVSENGSGDESNTMTQKLVESIISDIIDGVSHSVELSSATERALNACNAHTSPQDPSFWSDAHRSARCLFKSLLEQNAFQLMVTLCTLASGPVPPQPQGGDKAQETRLAVSQKVLALELLLVFLKSAKPRFLQSPVFGYQVRRFVVTAVLKNCNLRIPEVFRVLLAIISFLWKHFRTHLKIELAVLCENVLLRILRNADAPAKQQIDVLAEIGTWCDIPQNLVEMYINFDLDRSFEFSQFKTFEKMCSAMCSIAEGSKDSGSRAEENGNSRKDLQLQALECVAAVMKSLMDASGHAALVSQDEKMQKISTEGGGWDADELMVISPLDIMATDGILDADADGAGVQADRRKSQSFGVSTRVTQQHQQNRDQKEGLEVGLQLARDKSIQKALNYLIASKFLAETARDVTAFLRIHHDVLDEVSIGDYLGEGDSDFKLQVRLTYIRAMAFVGMTFEGALRHFLTAGGFRLPGEAQKIERLVEAFAQTYWSDNPEAFSCADTAMILAYSTIMLNTDLHSPQIKKNKRMKREEFISNNRGIDNGKDVQQALLAEIYNNIQANEIQTDFKKAVTKTTAKVAVVNDIKRFELDMNKTVHESLELLRGLAQAQRHHKFYTMGVDAKLSPDLIKFMVAGAQDGPNARGGVWYHFYSVVNAIMEDFIGDPEITSFGLDILKCAISTTLFLGITNERQAFVKQLFKLKAEIDKDNDPEMQTPEPDWVDTVNQDVIGNDDANMMVANVHKLCAQLQMQVHDRNSLQTLESVIARIHPKALLREGRRTFIREGDLVKKCRNRNVTYRFFLFSDQLMYCNKGISGLWNPHKQLPLKMCRTEDLADSMFHRNAFQVLNPLKAIVVIAESDKVKQSWMADIQRAARTANHDFAARVQLTEDEKLKTQVDTLTEVDEEDDDDADASSLADGTMDNVIA